MIKYNCDNCYSGLETDDTLSGKEEVCPSCGKNNIVPLSKHDKKIQREQNKAAKQNEKSREAEKTEIQRIKREKKLLTCRREAVLYQKQNEAKKKNKVLPSNDTLCILSFLFPIIGFIVGTMLLTRHDERDRNTGGSCWFYGVIGFIIWIVIYLYYSISVLGT